MDVQVAGTVKAPLSVRPTVADAPAASDPFQATFVAVRTPPASLEVAFHMLTLLPDHGIETDQPLIGAEPAFLTVRSTLRPLPQSEVTLTLTEIAEPAGTEGVALDVGVGVGATVGATVGVTVGAGVVELDEPPETTQVPAGIAHDVGVVVPPLGLPMNPKETDDPGVRPVLQVGPANRYPSEVEVDVASQTDVMPFRYGTDTDHGSMVRPELFVTRTDPWYPVPQSCVTVQSIVTSADAAEALLGSETPTAVAASVTRPSAATL